MSSILTDYFEALERLKKGRPLSVPKGSKITNDNVSMEAGRRKGTIKKGRPVFKVLIDAIEAAATAQAQPKSTAKAVLDAAKADTAKYRALWEESMGREVSLFYQFEKAQQLWAKEKSDLTGEKITSINVKRLRGG